MKTISCQHAILSNHDIVISIQTDTNTKTRPGGLPEAAESVTLRFMWKTGVIQPEPVTGQFPGNLRAMVDLYRTCLNDGAELVVCPALALGGMHTGELALRSGFKPQQQAALEYLAREIMDIPLLLGPQSPDSPECYLIRSGSIHACNGSGETPATLAVCRKTGVTDFRIVPYGDFADATPGLLLRFSNAPWHEGWLERDEEESRRLAQENKLPVLTARLAGGEGPCLLPGASSLWFGDRTLHGRLKLFERDAAVFAGNTAEKKEPSLPTGPEQLCMALNKGMSTFIAQSNHDTVCLNPEEGNSGPLLLHLLSDILPPSQISVFLSDQEGLSARLAEQYGVHTVIMPTVDDANELTTACRFRQWADEKEALLLSALNGTDTALNHSRTQAAVLADFMPLGDLYETELAGLFPRPAPHDPAPDQPQRDLLLARMRREHVSATHLSTLMPECETDIRRLQRRMRRQEWLWRKLPPRLMLRSTPGEPQIPAIHQLKD